MPKHTQAERYFSVDTPFGKDVLLLQRFAGEESFSGLFHFRLEMLSNEPALDFEAIVGKGVTVKVELAEGGHRYIHGICSRFIQAGQTRGFAVYHAELRPWLWLLSLTTNCRIFQQKKVPDIIEQTFKDNGQSDFDLGQLSGAYEPREFCVQYNENAFDFVSRLMEAEGIHYFFLHEEGRHRLVLGDDRSPWPKWPSALLYGTHELAVQQDVVTRCTREQNVLPDGVALGDFNFETPSTRVYSTAGSKPSVYEYPGGFLKTQAGERLAGMRLQEVAPEPAVLRGESYCPGLMPGMRFDLEDHYRDDVNGGYVVNRVAHTGELDVYTNHFDAISLAKPSWEYRPPRTTRRPTIGGTQTAIVVGPSGEEIHTDKYGRVKVQFHWDREGKSNETSSCFIRVAHGWAGKSWGHIQIPRIGQEVVVSFEEGDPDRPLITGAVYNAEQTVPYKLPDEQTKSTFKSKTHRKAGFNELRFEDKEEKQEIFFHAERDFNRVVKNNDTLKVGFETKKPGEQKIDIHKNRTVKIHEGNDSLEVSKGNRTVKISTGNDTLTVAKGNVTTKVSVGKSTTQATKEILLKVGSNSIKIDQKGITVKGLKISVDGSVKTEVKGTLTDVVAKGIATVKGALLKLN